MCEQGIDPGDQGIRDGDQARSRTQSVSAEPGKPVEGILEQILLVAATRDQP